MLNKYCCDSNSHWNDPVDKHLPVVSIIPQLLNESVLIVLLVSMTVFEFISAQAPKTLPRGCNIEVCGTANILSISST